MRPVPPPMGVGLGVGVTVGVTVGVAVGVAVGGTGVAVGRGVAVGGAGVGVGVGVGVSHAVNVIAHRMTIATSQYLVLILSSLDKSQTADNARRSSVNRRRSSARSVVCGQFERLPRPPALAFVNQI